MISRTRATLAAALLLGALQLVGLPAEARGHGALRRSVPASGARLDTVPRTLRLTFSERVELAVARLRLVGPGDAGVALSEIRAGASPEVVVADVVGRLDAGTYTVEWQIVGRDGHPVRGRFRFAIVPGASGLAAIDRAPPALAATADAPADLPRGPVAESVPATGTPAPHGAHPAGTSDAASPAYAAARWIGFAGALALIGAVGFTLGVVPRAARRAATGATSAAVSRTGDGARALGLAAAATLAAGALLRLVAQSHAVNGTDGALDAGHLAALIGRTRWGTGWLLQAGGALVAAGALLLVRRLGRTAWWIVGAATVAIAVGAALSGHAAAVSGVGALAVAADAAHVLAAGGWLGTLLFVALVGVPAALREPAGERGAVAAALVHAFSPVALACAALVAVTGLAAAWWHVGSPGALLTSRYGRTLLVKLGALAIVAGIGLYNWRRVRPVLGDEPGARRVRRSSLAEVAVGAIVLAVTAVLVATPTPMDGAP